MTVADLTNQLAEYTLNTRLLLHDRGGEKEVVIPACYGVTNGVWFRVKQGMRGLLVRTQVGEPVVFMLCEPATRYYRVMTRAEWMPCLLGEVI